MQKSGVPNGDEVVPVANFLAPHFRRVVATQDWHPAEHSRIAANHPDRTPGGVVKLGDTDQILWPVHCVQGSSGAEFAPGLLREPITYVVQKDIDPAIDSYSGFFDNGHLTSTGLADLLRNLRTRGVHFLGLATDYCVKFAAFAARRVRLEGLLVADERVEPCARLTRHAFLQPHLRAHDHGDRFRCRRHALAQ